MAAEPNRLALTGSALIVAILAAIGISSPLLKTQSNQPKVVPSPAQNHYSNSKHATEGYEHSAADLLEDYLDADSDQFQSNRPWSQQARKCLNSHQCWSGEPRLESVKFLIATMPEPDSPPLSYKFDTQLDAISAALRDADYVLDSFDLPWLENVGKESGDFRLGEDIEIKGQGPFDLRNEEIKADTEDEKRWEHDPGIMLFRKGLNQLVVLFFVGETPTAGINKSQLRSALDQLAWLQGWRGGDYPSLPQPLKERLSVNDRTVLILGPTFSGSEPSFVFTLDTWLDSFSEISAGCSMSSIGAGAPHCWPKIKVYSGTATAIEPNDPAVTEFHYKPERIVHSKMWPLITEELMGQSVSGADGKFNKSNQASLKILLMTDDTSFGASVDDNKLVKDSMALRVFRFPLHISDFRTAFDRGLPNSSMIATSPLKWQDLPLPDESGSEENDVVPAFSKRASMYDELVIANVLATINREQIGYVGINATDIEDLIFLAHEVRQMCHDVVLFTTTTDLRFLHSDVNNDLVGTLVFSTYPLFNPKHGWGLPRTDNDQGPLKSLSRKHRWLKFPNEEAAGVYDATLDLLDRPELMLDNSPPFYSGHDQVLWESVIGRDIIWPLRYLIPGNSDAKELINRGNLNLENGLYPVASQIGFLLLSFFCLSGLIMIGREFGQLSIDRRRFRSPLLFDEPHFGYLRTEHRLHIATFSGLLLLSYLLALGFYLIPWPWFVVSKLAWVSISRYLGSMLGVLLLVIFVLALTGIPWRKLKQAGRIPFIAIVTLCSVIFGLVCGGVFLRGIWIQSPSTRLFIFLRSIHFENGISPITPLFFIAVAAFALVISDLRRIGLLQEYRVKLPFLSFEATHHDSKQSFAGTTEMERRLFRLVTCADHQLPWVLWVLFGLVFAFLYFAFWSGRRIGNAIDGATYNTFVIVVSFFIYLRLCFLLLRFVVIWLALKRLLNRLYWHPARGSYEVLRTTMLPSRQEDQRISLLQPWPDLTPSEYGLARARAILEQQGDRLLAEKIRRAESAIGSMLASDRHASWKLVLEAHVHLQSSMAQVSRQVIRIAEPLWRLGNRNLPARSSATQIKNDAELFVASRVVDLLRHIFPQLRHLMTFAMIGVLAMMLAISSYPFSPHDTLLSMTWVWLLAVIAISTTLFVQINRNRIVSILSGTEPGHFSWDSTFTLQLLIYAVVPILALLGAQFPHVFTGIFSWIEGYFTGAK